MNIEHTVDYQVRATLFSMARMYNLKAQEYGITQGIGYVLIIIPREGIPATSIAPIMGMGSSSLSRLLKGMEKNGYIFRKTSKKDKRVSNVFLTQEGVKLRRKTKNLVVKFNERIAEKIAPEELLIFNKVSSEIRNQIDNDIKSHLKKDK